MIKLEFAPMEGITGYVFRNAYNKCFGGVDEYYTYFIEPSHLIAGKSRENQDILPDNNKGINLVPQLLTNNADKFIKAAEVLKEQGYRKVNLNLGCPSKTVAAKKKGSGFLSDPEMLDRFLYDIFENTDMKISIKTRLGVENTGEFPRLMAIYGSYPIDELIIHPRLQKEYYAGDVHLDMFEYAMDYTDLPITYNGDIFSKQVSENIINRFKNISALMIGRGALMDTGLFSQIREPGAEQMFIGSDRAERDRLHQFHDEVFEGYCSQMKNPSSAILRMKELWTYMIAMFINPVSGNGTVTETDERKICTPAGVCITDREIIKGYKKLKKSASREEYLDAVALLFSSV